jgi:hypothetical protein
MSRRHDATPLFNRSSTEQLSPNDQALACEVVVIIGYLRLKAEARFVPNQVTLIILFFFSLLLSLSWHG